MRVYSGCYSVLAMLAALAFMSQPANAIPIAFDGFVQSFPLYANGGTGFSAPWVVGGFNAAVANYNFVDDVSLIYPSLEASVGGSVSGVAALQINGSTRALAQTLPETFYVSFLLQPNGTLGEGDFGGFFGLTLNGSSNDLFIGKPGAHATDQYILETRGGGGQVPSGVQVDVDHTAFLVLKAQGNDAFSLFVNPKPGQSEPSHPDALKTDLDLGNVNRIGIYSTGAFTIDEIRIGTTYEDVTPKAGGN